MPFVECARLRPGGLSRICRQIAVRKDARFVARGLLSRVHHTSRPAGGTRGRIPEEDVMPSQNGRYGSLKRLWEAGSREVQRGLRVLLEGPSDPVEVTAPEELGPN